MRVIHFVATLPLCHFFYLGATWISVTSALPSAEQPDYGSRAATRNQDSVILEPNFSLGPSIDAAPSTDPSHPLNLIPSQQPESTHFTLSSVLSSILLTLGPSAIIPTVPSPTSAITLIPTGASPIDVTTILISSRGNATGTLSMTSTVQDLRPIPPAVTEIGDPNGHHEIPEPNFSSTRPCRGCSPVFEIPATGWLDTPVGEQHCSTVQEPTAHATTEKPPLATVSAGASNIVIDQDPNGSNLVIGGTYTLTPDQTITVGDTPIAMETSDGRTRIVVGTTIVSLQPVQPAITDAPIPQPPIRLPPILTIGTQTISPNAQTQYVIAGETLSPGGEPLTISGTTFMLAPSATALIVNGGTSSITPRFRDVYTTVVAALTFKDHVYTPNRAGYIVMGPGTTLVPGGAPIMIDGTTLSLDHSGTAVVVQGTTRTLQSATTIVTLTRNPDALGTSFGGSSGDLDGQATGGGFVYSTGDSIVAGAVRTHGTIARSWPAGLLLLVWWGVGYLAFRL